MKTRETLGLGLIIGAFSVAACGDEGSTEGGGHSGKSGSAGSAGISGTGGDQPGGDGGTAGTAGRAGSTGTGGATSGAGGEGGGGNVPGPPKLLRTTPEADATNVWFYAPVVLVFSEPLDPATVTDDSVTVSVGGTTLSGALALSRDETTITVELDDPPDMLTRATVEVADTLADPDGETFAGASFDYQLPLWQRPGGNLGSSTSAPVVAAGANDALVVGRIDGGELVVRSYDGAAWQTLDGLDAPASDAALVLDETGMPIVAWTAATSATDGLGVSRWDGSAWRALGDLSDEVGAAAPALALDAEGNPVVAWAVSGTISVSRYANGDWQLIDDTLAVGMGGLGTASATFGFTMDGDAPVVARYVVASGGGVQTPMNLRIERLDGTWATLGGDIARSRASVGARPTLARAADGVLFVGYDDGDAVTSNGFVRRFGSSNGMLGGWEAVGPALDLVLDAEVTAPSVGVSADGVLYAAWHERYGSSEKAYAARWDEAGWTTLSQPLNVMANSAATASALAIDAHGNPNVAFAEGDAVYVKRFNGSPSLPFGISRRASTAGCSIPPDASMTFPQTLTATGCFTDVPNRVLVAGAIPFELNSPLWSDGAHKRRYLVLPDGTSMGYVPSGALAMPVGTIIVKEFLYPTVAGDPGTLIAMETRFLVKRCDDGATGCDAATAWQGYSYQWNSAHTEATLLPDAASTLSWPYSEAGTETMHVHSYPSRQQCVQCHNAAAGRVLGIQAGQLNRSLDYGGVVDNQLRVLEHIGVLTGVASAAKPRLPSPNDQSFSLEQRARGYFHSNCSHCHRAGGTQLTVDFRYDVPLSAMNICNKLLVGDPDQSRVYRKDSYRGPAPMPASGSEPGGGNQMPPLATLAADSRQLAVTYAWIDSMQSCP